MHFGSNHLRFHKDNLRHLSRFPDFFVFKRILSTASLDTWKRFQRRQKMSVDERKTIRSQPMDFLLIFFLFLDYFVPVQHSSLHLFITGGMLLLTLPILTGALLMVLADLHSNTLFFDPIFGGDPIFYQLKTNNQTFSFIWCLM